MDGAIDYKRLPEYAAQRYRELSGMVTPYVQVTDRYGELVCVLVRALGRVPPNCTQDEVCRDLLADVFDFLYESRPIDSGKPVQRCVSAFAESLRVDLNARCLFC
jgi:hypothetical protein